MNSREQILGTLRANQRPFPNLSPRPNSYAPVTRFNAEDRLARFTTEVEQRFGVVHITADEQSALQAVLSLCEPDKLVMAWENLPLPGLTEALAEQQIQVVNVRARHEERLSTLVSAEKIRVGITGVDAAFATTGTLALVTKAGQGRVPSLLPPVHIALLRRDRLFERLEDWFAGEGHEALRQSSSVALITGPSSTGDIEHHTVLGAHGPGTVHIIML
jgi:L-lactate dehydrogenase complex protein LldG